MMKRYRFVAIGLAASLSLATNATSAAPAVKAPKNAYGLTLQAVQDVNNVTDVYVTVTPASSNVQAADEIKHLQMKTFDAEGDLLWTKNAFDVPLEADGSATTARLSYEDMSRYQPVQARVQVQTYKTGRTSVLNTSAPVFLRPDLSIGEITANETVRVGEVVNITAAIKELNGDLGAEAKVSLSNGTGPLDHAEHVAVAAHGDAAVVFSTRFTEPGSYTLTVNVDSAKPGDYDTRNNSKQVTITAVDDVTSVPYFMTYTYSRREYVNTWDSVWGSGTQTEDGESQDQYGQLNLAGYTVLYPLDVSLEMRADGNPDAVITKTATGINPTSSWSVGCRSGQYTSSNLGDNVYLYVQTVDLCGLKSGSAQYQQHAADYVYFSDSHDYYWGNQQSSSNVANGIMVRAEQSVQTRFVVESADGRSYGGDMNIPNFYYSPWDYTWESSNPYGTSSGRNTGYSLSGRSGGMTQP